MNNIPEIDLPKSDNATNSFPLEFGNDNSSPKNEPTYPNRSEPGRE